MSIDIVAACITSTAIYFISAVHVVVLWRAWRLARTN